ncbi:MAG: anti-sigma factor family protein [Nocardioides sp.]
MSALLDGQLPPEESERAWTHVHGCHACRDLVEREGWVKTRLAGLSYGEAAAPAHLKGSLLGGPSPLAGPMGDAYLAPREDHRSRINTGLVAIGGSAVGAAVMGVLALGVAPADTPNLDRRAPVSNLVRPTETPRTPAPAPTASLTPSFRASLPARHH